LCWETWAGRPSGDDDLERCAACFEECLSLSEALGDEARARAIVNRGWLHARRGELPAARDSVAAALNRAQDPRTRFAAAGLLLRLGRIERLGNDDTSARRSLTTAHEVFQALGDANAAYAAAELEILGPDEIVASVSGSDQRSVPPAD
jgi:hypothetical protein